MHRTPFAFVAASAFVLAQEPTSPPPAPPADTTATPAAPTPPPPIDPALLAGLKFRSIGPAVCSGRIGAVAGIPGDPSTIWVGAASGGIWKSTDGGVRFTPVFDDQDCTSIGALAIDPRAPDVVWAGSGEGNPRNSASVGRGIYKTTDAGKTWQKLGLEQTEHIHRVVLHPDDPNTAFVAALGTTWAEREDRGVYRTRDGGKTWDKVLYTNPTTGACTLVMDPRNPQKLFAGMWDHRRWPWTFQSGGPGSGLYRSTDGGTTWQKLGDDDGLPNGELGRSCFAISPSDPRIVYALVESEKNALYRSDDGGFRWQQVNATEDIAPRPFYFCDIAVDPHDSSRVYNLHMVIDVSTDAGRTFSTLIGWEAHPDHHAIWIDPMEPRRVLIGNDGGVYQSLDRGSSWRFCSNLPLAQFYHVAVDDQVPYNIYGGLQDNGSWRGPSTVWENGGIRNQHWQEVCFGDGFATLPDPLDPRQGYAMSQGGELIRFDLRTGQQKSIQPPAPDGVKLRFNWNAAIAQDPQEPGTIWYGSQFVHRSADRGESWAIVSPDLTTNNPEWQKQDLSGGITLDATGAENHCTILTIAPSPVQRGVVWVGTDDGRVQVTRDGGQSWASVEDKIEGLPRNTWCPHIEPSRFDAGTAFAVFDGHRRADWTPYVYRTTDFGQTWTSLATKDIEGYCLVIEQDPIKKDLLFLGTEFGLWVTLDGGATWHRYKHGIPTCSAMAMLVHPKTSDLIVATHGRSLFVLDDMTPLRTLTPELAASKLHLFPIQDAIAWTSRQTGGERFPGQGEFRGETRTRGALLHVLVSADELKHPDAKTEKARAEAKKAAKKDEPKKEAGDAKPAEGDVAAAKPKKKEEPKDQITVEVRDAQGTLIRTFRQPVQLGLNRVVWSLQRDGVQAFPSREVQEEPELPPSGREVLPGDYEIAVRFQGEERRERVRVLPDPRVEVAMADRLAKDQAQSQRQETMLKVTAATQRFAKARREIELVKTRLSHEPKVKDGQDDPQAEFRKAVEAIDKAVTELDEKLWGPKPKPGINVAKGLLTELQEAAGALTRTPEKPNPTELLGLQRAAGKAEEVVAAVEAFVAGPMVTFRAAVEKSGLSLLPAGK